MEIVLKFIETGLILSSLLFCSMCGYQYAIYDNDLIEKPISMKIAENLNAESGYNIHTWDCSNMTEELIIRLQQQGYNASYGKVKYNNTCHAIVQYTQYIEATTGQFINPNIDNNYTFDRIGCRY